MTSSEWYCAKFKSLPAERRWVAPAIRKIRRNLRTLHLILQFTNFVLEISLPLCLITYSVQKTALSRAFSCWSRKTWDREFAFSLNLNQIPSILNDIVNLKLNLNDYKNLLWILQNFVYGSE